ncbi:MAG: ABC transporter permease subunit [Treponema sp.]|nr:ABC transporter permease subunit [Treponema sp.]
MMLVPIIYFIVFKYLPMFGNILAFRRYRPGLGPWGTEWVGFMYFERFLKDPMFLRALRNTIQLSLFGIVVNFPLPIIFAIILSEARIKWFKKVVQTVSYMPYFISVVVVVTMMEQLLSPSGGLLNKFLGNFGIAPIYFMNLAEWFRPIYVLSDTWQSTGWSAIIYLAAITNINHELFEAAEIDGAGRIKKIWYVTIPSILPTVMMLLILRMGSILSVSFEKVLLLYTPANSYVSDVLSTMVYRVGIVGSAGISGSSPNYSYGTAMGLFLGVVGVILVQGSNRLSRKLTSESLF